MNGMNPYNEKLRKAATPRVIKIRKLRASGFTWAEIGNLLGISRQRAQQLGSRSA